MKFDSIPTDCIIDISEYLSNFEKIYFLSVCRKMHLLKKYVYLYEKVFFRNMLYDLNYYDMFTYFVCDSIIRFPLHIKKIIFADKFNQDIKSCIPTSVTHLTFG